MSQVYFDPPSKVRVGAGAVWKQVLDVVDPKVFTMIHGNVSLIIDFSQLPILIISNGLQAKNVGVGGFLLGVGANPLGTTHRHGFGADNVLEYKLVLADGRIAVVDKDNTTILGTNEYGQR